MSNTLIDLVKITANSTGTGAITLGRAVPSYRGTEVLTDGAVYSYSIQQEAEWEFGSGTYFAQARTLVRSPLGSSNGGQPINLQPNAAVAFVATAADLYELAGVTPPVDTNALAREVARATAAESFLSTRIAAAALGIVTYPTIAAMNADLNRAIGTYAIVTENNRSYRWSGTDWLGDDSLGMALALFVQPLVDRAETAATTATAAAAQAASYVQNLTRDATEYIGRPGDAVLVDGTPQGIGSIYWHDLVDHTGALTHVDVFDLNAATVNLAVYRGPLNNLTRVGLTTFTTQGGGTQRRIALAAAQPVLPGDLLAVQSPTEGPFTINEVQSGDAGYTYSFPSLPETMTLGDPTTNGQVQLRFVIAYREQVVTADRFLAVEAAVETLPAIQAAVDDLFAPALEYIGRPGDAPLFNGDPASSSAVWWRDVIDHDGTFADFDLYDRQAGTINVAVYRGSPDNLTRIALTTATATGANAVRRVTLATPIAVKAGDMIALQAAAGTFAIVQVQSGDAGYSYSGPSLPTSIGLGPPNTGGQYQVRFRISHMEQVVTAERFLQLEGGGTDAGMLRMDGFAVREVATNRFGFDVSMSGPRPDSMLLEWGGYALEFDGGWRGMVLPSTYGPTTGVIAEGNSLTDPNDGETGGGWATKYAQSLGVPVYGLARYSSDSKQVYRSGATPVLLTVANNQLLASGQATTITSINGLPPGPSNPASLLFTFAGDGTTVNNTIVGYFAGRPVTISVSTGGGSDYKVTQSGSGGAVDVVPDTLFKPDFALRMGVADLVGMPGINYFYDPNAPDLLNALAKSDTIKIYRQQRGQRVMVLGSPPDASWTPGTPAYTAIRNWNNWLKATFPRFYAVDAQGRDTLARLLASGNGSAGDNADVTNGVTPRSLRKSGDSLHLNTAGQQVVANLASEYRALQAAPPAITRDTVFTLTARTATARVSDVARAS